MENSLNCKCFRHAGSIRHAGGSNPVQQSVLPPELRPAPYVPMHTYPNACQYDLRVMVIGMYVCLNDI